MGMGMKMKDESEREISSFCEGEPVVGARGEMWIRKDTIEGLLSVDKDHSLERMRPKRRNGHKNYRF